MIGNPMHNFLAFLPFIIFSVFILIIIASRFIFNPVKKKMGELGGRINRNGEGVFSIDGQPITLKYTPGSRNRSPEFSLSTSGSFGADLVIRRETSQDRFYKKIGLNQEVPISDRELEDKFYFECDVPEFVNQLLSNADVKPLVLDIFNTFSSIVITQNICIFKLYPSSPLEDIAQESITDASRKLLSFVRFIPQNIGEPHPELASFRMWRFILYFIGITALVGGMVFFIWASVSFRIVDEARAWYWSLTASISVVVCMLYLAYLKIKGFSTSSRVFICFLITFSMGTLLSARFGGAVYNGVFDQSSTKKFEQVVINKYTTTHKGTRTYHVVIEPWHPAMSYWESTVTHRAYTSISLGSTLYQIFTKSGRLGFEWVVGERVR